MIRLHNKKITNENKEIFKRIFESQKLLIEIDIKEHKKLLEQHRNDIENGVYMPGESFKKTEELFDKLRELISHHNTSILNLEKIDYFINKNE